MSAKQLKTCVNNVLKSYLKNSLYMAMCLTLLSVPALSQARQAERVPESSPLTVDVALPFEMTQSNGMTLPQAVESVRRRGNVKQVLSANTKVSNGREVHHIKVLTKDGKVKTVTVQGRKRN